MLESASHIRNKAGLLKQLHQVADKLVVRVNTYDGPPPPAAPPHAAGTAAVEEEDPRTVFGGSMVLPSTDEMVALIEQAGWTVRRVENIRRRTRPICAIRGGL